MLGLMDQGKLEVVKKEMARVNRHFGNQLTEMDGNGQIYIISTVISTTVGKNPLEEME